MCKQLETPQLIRWRDVGPVCPRSRMHLDNFRSLNSNNASRSNNTRGTSEEKSEARDGRSDEATREHRGQPRPTPSRTCRRRPVMVLRLVAHMHRERTHGSIEKLV